MNKYNGLSRYKQEKIMRAFCNIIRKRSLDDAQAMERLQDLPSMI